MKNYQKVDKWFNTNHTQLKLKKTPMTKSKTGIKTNTQIFLRTYKKINNKQIIDDQLEKSEESLVGTEKKSKKKKIFNIIFFCCNLLLVAGVFWNFAREQGGVQPLRTLFDNRPRWSYLFIALGLFLATLIFNSLKFMFLVHSKTKKWRPWFCFKLATIGKYYEYITPLKTGGKAFEIYYLKHNKYSSDTSTAIPLSKAMIWMLTSALFGVAILIFFPSTYNFSTFISVFAWLGIILIFLLFLFVFLMSTTKHLGASIVVGVLKFLYKLHLIKNYQQTLVKVLKFVKQYQYSFKSFAKNPICVIMVSLSSLASLIAGAMIAYFVYASFILTPEISIWEMICKCVVCDLAISLIPLPGGSGASELSFNALLGSLFPTGTLFWGILIWRILTYYLYIIIGELLLLFTSILSKKTHQKAPHKTDTPA